MRCTHQPRECPTTDLCEVQGCREPAWKPTIPRAGGFLGRLRWNGQQTAAPPDPQEPADMPLKLSETMLTGPQPLPDPKIYLPQLPPGGYVPLQLSKREPEAEQRQVKPPDPPQADRVAEEPPKKPRGRPPKAAAPPAPPGPQPNLAIVVIPGGWIVYRGAAPVAVASTPAELGARVAELVEP